MGKRCIALICMIIVSITGCGGRDDSVLDFREQKKEMAIYTEAAVSTLKTGKKMERLRY